MFKLFSVFLLLFSAINFQNPARAEWYSGIFSSPAGLCDRSFWVREAVLYKLNKKHCGKVTEADLAVIESLVLTNKKGYFETFRHGDFDGLVSLKKLDFSNNGITELPRGIFDELKKLQELNLSGNQIAAIPEGLFEKLTKLDIINLSRNKLTVLHVDLFDDLYSLSELDLSYNFIAAIPEGLFYDLDDIEKINLSGNQIKELSDIYWPDSIEGLDLSRNQIAAIFDEMEWPEYLRDLNLSGNQIKDFFFNNKLYRLSRFDLSHNKITIIDVNNFHNVNRLEFLDLSHNQIEEFIDYDRPFPKMRHLTTLNLSHNQIKNSVKGGEFFGTRMLKLKNLNLSYNQIEELPESLLTELPHASRIDLTGNNITLSHDLLKEYSRPFIFLEP